MKKILVVVDMQKDFVDGALGTPEAVAIVDNVVKKIEEYGSPCPCSPCSTGEVSDDAVQKEIIVTYDTHFENYMETAEGRNLPVPHCIKGTEGHKLDTRVQAALDATGKDYKVIEKLTFGSVNLPDAVAELVKKGSSPKCVSDEDFEIELIGLCTDICVVSNALILKANFYEKEITVDASCCAGVTPETHNASLATMKMCQINVINQ